MNALTSTAHPLVLLPGLVCDATVWAHVRAAMSVRPTVTEYGALDSLGAMAEKVLREAPRRFALAGHSMGGRVALEVLRRAPERIAGIALLDTGTQPLAAGEAGERETAGRHELLQIARNHGMAAMAARWVQGMVWKPRLTIPRWSTASSRCSRAAPRRSSRLRFARCSRAPMPADYCPAFAVRRWCSAAQEDSWAPAARHREMAALIPGARLVLDSRTAGTCARWSGPRRSPGPCWTGTRVT